jgi:phenylalanyl-tRNA synthetase beta chain
MGAPARTQILRDVPGWWHPGRAGRITLGPKITLALFGEVHPRILAAYDIKGPAVALTCWPARVPLPRRSGATRPALEAAGLQFVERDFAFVVDAEMEAARLVQAAQGAHKALIEDVRVFDEFTGPQAEEQMGPGKKSLALTVRLQPREATLKEAEIEAVSAAIVRQVEKATKGVLRG